MKKHLFAVCYCTVLIVFSVSLALDTFVLSKSYNTNAGEMNTAMFSQLSSDEEETPDSNSNSQQMLSASSGRRQGAATMKSTHTGRSGSAGAESSGTSC